MKCPRCSNDLQRLNEGGVIVDACRHGCGGIWFDAHELEKMDSPDESAGWLLTEMPINLNVPVDLAQRIDCPRCENVRLSRIPYPNRHEIIIDKCPSCDGVWLDFGELYAIRLANNPDTTEAVAHQKAAAVLRKLLSPH